MRLNLLLATGAMALAGLPCMSAQAQDAHGVAINDAAAIGDIIVTAQKREQRITDVPMSISAYGSDVLEQIAGTELSRISAITPGFVIQLQDKFSPGFAIRGITTNEINPQAEQRIAVFQDGVPVTQGASAYGELFDLDRVEVEKGPQSTLHGRSALNGGVSIFQKRPSDNLAFELNGGLGNYNYQHIEGVANVPLSDTFAVRFGALIRKRDGFIKDTDGLGTYNEQDARAYRFAAKWEPSDRLRFNLIATYDVDDTEGGVPFKSATFLPLNQTTGAIAGDLRFWTPLHVNTFGSIPEAYFHREILGISATAEFEINDRFTLASITGYRWFDACQSGDNDGTSTNIISYYQCNRGRQYSEELRLNFNDVGPLEGFIGASAFKAKNRLDFEFGYDERALSLLRDGTLQRLAPRGLTNSEINALLGPGPSPLKPFHLDRSLNSAEITTYDVFADFTVHLADRLEVFAGGRVTWDKKEVALQNLTPNGPSGITGGGIFYAPTPGGAVLSGARSSSNVTGRAGVRFELTPHVNLFAVYGIGKRPEILTILPSGAESITPVEKLTSVEGGVKFRLLGGRLIGDASVYHYDYDNFVTQALVNGRPVPTNAGKASATGFETQVNFTLVSGISVLGSYGYNHGRFKTGLYNGNHFRNSPDHKLSVGANLSMPVKDGTISFAPLYSWQSKMFFADDNDRLDLQVRRPAALSDTVIDEFQNGYGLLSARLAFESGDNKWTLALVGDNLTDKKFVVDAGNSGEFFGVPTFIGGPRRNFRVEFGVNF